MRLLRLVLLLPYGTNAFIVSRATTHQHTSKLFGISEWRDNVFCEPSATSPATTELRKPVCLLPFSYEEALVQGQTKELRLYEDRFLQLFDDVMDNHESVVAMALISEEDEGILSSVPLCEIVDFNRMAGEGFGVFLTIKCVGRAELKDASQEGLYIKAECVEIMDEGTPDMQLANEMADGIEELVTALSQMEEDLGNELEKQAIEGTFPEEVAVRNDSDEFYDDDDDLPTRMERYQEAYKNALESDTQGYFSGASSAEGQRSAQELTAISWAAFTTESMDEFDAAYRLQALDSEDLAERLKLGFFLLNEKKNLVQDIIKRGRNGEIDDEFA